MYKVLYTRLIPCHLIGNQNDNDCNLHTSGVHLNWQYEVMWPYTTSLSHVSFIVPCHP